MLPSPPAFWPSVAIRAAPACTAMAESWWATTSCSSRAMRVRSAWCAAATAAAVSARRALAASPSTNAAPSSANGAAASLMWFTVTVTSATASATQPSQRAYRLVGAE